MINRNAEASEPAQIGHNLVDIAPAPALGWVVTFDDRVPCRLEVSCCVPVRRVVAAPDMAAGPAQAANAAMATRFSGTRHSRERWALHCGWRLHGGIRRKSESPRGDGERSLVAHIGQIG